MDFIFGKWSFSKLPAFIVIFGILAICLFYYFDNRLKLKVDSNGIWTIKYKNIPRSEIWYFSSVISNMREGDLYYLTLRLKDTDERIDKEIKIRYRRMDKKFSDVREVIAYYAAKHNILDMGHEREE